MEVLVIFGSLSDKEKILPAIKCLEEFGVNYEAHVCSAHRASEKLDEILEKSKEKNVKVIIAAAGLAAHLPGVIASKVMIPVIGIPINVELNGNDALYSIVQMPKSIPVACVGINNSYNAAMLAIQILSLSNEKIKEKLINFRDNMKKDFINTKVEF